MDGMRKDASILSESRGTQMDSRAEQTGVVRTALPNVVEDSSAIASKQRRELGARPGSRDFVLRRLLALADVAALVTALAFTLIWGRGITHSPQHLLLGLATVPVWLVIFKAY